jgi:hypothetical protein
MSRCRLFAAVAAGVLLSAAPALAQFPGGADTKPQPGTPADAIKQLQAQLERTKAMEDEIQAMMKQLQEAAKAAQGAKPFDRGGFGGLPVERMSAEQVKELIGQLQKVLEEKTRGEKGTKVGDKPGTKPGQKPGVKFVEKPGVKPAVKPAVKPGTEKPGAEKPGKPGVKPGTEKPGAEKPGTVSNEELRQRLDKLSIQIEELRKSIQK